MTKKTAAPLPGRAQPSNGKGEEEKKPAATVIYNRPARRQIVKRAGPQRDSGPAPRGSGTYNIWYNRWEGDRDRTRVKVTTRCCLATDAGLTRGDQPHMRQNAFVCLHFARGDCSQGAQCLFLHRLPDDDFDAKLPTSKDCFGRDRHACDREDMGGVGGILKDIRRQKALYVGGVPYNMTNYDDVFKYFSEWGDIERVYILRRKCVAFVHYRLRSQAEFAKEAMDRHSLAPDGDGMLNLRWATEDMNPERFANNQLAAEADLLEAHIKRYGEDFLTDESANFSEEAFAKHGVIGQYPGAPPPPPPPEAVAKESASSTTDPSATSAPGHPPTYAHIEAWTSYPSMVPDSLLPPNLPPPPSHHMQPPMYPNQPFSTGAYGFAGQAPQNPPGFAASAPIPSVSTNPRRFARPPGPPPGPPPQARAAQQHLQAASGQVPHATGTQQPPTQAIDTRAPGAHEFHSSPYEALAASLEHTAKRFKGDSGDARPVHAQAQAQSQPQSKSQAPNGRDSVLTSLAAYGGGSDDEDSD